jgi:hypothetical protein
VLAPLVLCLDLIWRLLLLRLKILSIKLLILLATVFLSPPCDACGSLKGKVFHATKENTELKQDVVYFTACLEKTVLSEKMIEEDMSGVEESATKSHIIWGLGLRDVRKRMRRVLLGLFLAPATIKKRKHSNQPKPTTHPIQSHHPTQREK